MYTIIRVAYSLFLGLQCTAYLGSKFAPFLPVHTYTSCTRARTHFKYNKTVAVCRRDEPSPRVPLTVRFV